MKPDENDEITITEPGLYWIGVNTAKPTPLTREAMRRAFDKGVEMAEHRMNQPVIMRHAEMLELQRIGIVKDGRIDMAALNAYRRKH